MVANLVEQRDSVRTFLGPLALVIWFACLSSYGQCQGCSFPWPRALHFHPVAMCHMLLGWPLKARHLPSPVHNEGMWECTSTWKAQGRLQCPYSSHAMDQCKC